MGEMMSVKQAAAALGLAVPSLRKLIHRREIEFFQIHRKIGIQKSEIERILNRAKRPVVNINDR